MTIKEKLCNTLNKDVNTMNFKEIMDTPITLTVRELTEEIRKGVDQQVQEELKEKISCLAPKSIQGISKDKKIIVDLHWSSQFCGMLDKTVIVSASTTKEDIEQKLFPQELGVDYDENCWYEVYHLIDSRTLYMLYEDSCSYTALAQGGVDNWEWCSEAFQEYIKTESKDITWEEFIEQQFKKEWGNYYGD